MSKPPIPESLHNDSDWGKLIAALRARKLIVHVPLKGNPEFYRKGD